MKSVWCYENFILRCLRMLWTGLTSSSIFSHTDSLEGALDCRLNLSSKLNSVIQLFILTLRCFIIVFVTCARHQGLCRLKKYNTLSSLYAGVSGWVACARNILFNKEKIIYQAYLIQKSLFIKVCSILMPLAMSPSCVCGNNLWNMHAEHVIAVCVSYMYLIFL